MKGMRLKGYGKGRPQRPTFCTGRLCFGEKKEARQGPFLTMPAPVSHGALASAQQGDLGLDDRFCA